jgi:adenylate kinase
MPQPQPHTLLQGKLLFPFIAPPNGGKGTQTQILAQQYNLPTFDMGSTFRAILKEGYDPQLKAELESFMNEGKLVPVETVIKVFKKNFEQLAAANPLAKGFILDGFPRSQEQATALAALCHEWKAQLAKVIYLNVPLDVVRARATGRRFCSKDVRHVYNVNDARLAPQSKKMRADGQGVETDAQSREIWLCSADDAELVVRKDDEPHTVEKRLAEYCKETDPLIDYYRQTQELAEINGDQPPERVTQAIEAVIHPLLALMPIS